MKLKIEIDLDGAAFDGDRAGPEASRILRNLALFARECGGLDNFITRLYDINGNTVGTAVVE